MVMYDGRQLLVQVEVFFFESGDKALGWGHVVVKVFNGHAKEGRWCGE